MKTSRRPVFVIGAPFSGSSILQWSLAQHPAFVAVLDTSWLRPFALGLRSVYDTGVAEAESSQLVAMRMARERFLEVFGSVVNDFFLGAGVAEDGESRVLNLGASGGAPGMIGSPTRARRWIDASPECPFDVTARLNVFPRAQFIHVVRDAREVALALAAASPERYTEEAAYQHWLNAVRSGIEAELAFGSKTVLRVRYADLLAFPDETLRECLTFLDEPFDDACLRPLRSGGDVRPRSAPAQSPTTAAPLPLDSVARREAEFLSRILLTTKGGKYARDEERVAQLQRAFERAERRPRTWESTGVASQSTVERARELVAAAVPAGARVVVISKGDTEIVKLEDREGWHFPQAPDGGYAGYHPGESAEAITQLEALRARGADYLLIPSTAFWWIDYYAAFREHLEERYPIVAYQHDAGLILALRDSEGSVQRRVSVRGALRESPAAALKT